VKVPVEKAADYEKLWQEIGMPIERGRVAAGEKKGTDVLRAVVPIGRSARCDYLIVNHYGLLPEELPIEGITEDARRVGLDVTGEEVMAKLRALQEVVGLEWWWYLERVGPAWPQGSYIRINHWQLNEGVSWDDHRAFGQRIWKPIVEGMLAAGRKVSWDDVGVGAPYRADGYQTLTLDVFHDWETMVTTNPFLFGDDGLWSKVHPNMTPTELGRHDRLIRKNLATDVYRVAFTTTR